MFFACGLSLKGKEVLVNPDQVLYVRRARLFRHKTALILTHRRRLVVDQDTQTVRQRFEEYLHDVTGHAHTHHDLVSAHDGGTTPLQ